MANEADKSQPSQELAISLAVRQARKAGELTPTGRCGYCGAALAGELRFCDADCRDDYERQALRRRYG